MKNTTSVFILAILAIASSGGLERSAWSYDVDVFDLAGRNDTPDSATNLGQIGSSALFYKALTIDQPGDIDYFTWTALFSDTLQIDILFEHSKSGDLDTSVRRSYMTLDHSDSLTDNEQLIADVTAGETYLMRVYGYNGSVNSYDLGFSFPGKNAPGGGGTSGGGNSGGGNTGGGGTTDPPPVLVGDAANKLIGLLDYMGEYLLDRSLESFIVSPLQQALKELNTGAHASTVVGTLQNIVNAPIYYRDVRGNMVSHVKSATLDIMNDLSAGAGLRMRTSFSRFFRAAAAGGVTGDGQTSVGYDPTTGEVWVDAPTGAELTSINIDSVSGIFTGESAESLGGSFDNSTTENIFKATFGSSFGSLSFGKVAQAGLAEEFLLDDLTIVGSLAGGGGLGDVDLIYVPEPSAWAMASLGLFGLLAFVRRHRRNVA